MATDIQLHIQQAQELSNKLWAIANDLRGTMDASKFKDYILGIIFYRFLSEKTEKYMEEILKNDGITHLFSSLRSGRSRKPRLTVFSTQWT